MQPQPVTAQRPGAVCRTRRPPRLLPLSPGSCPLSSPSARSRSLPAVSTIHVASCRLHLFQTRLSRSAFDSRRQHVAPMIRSTPFDAAPAATRDARFADVTLTRCATSAAAAGALPPQRAVDASAPPCPSAPGRPGAEAFRPPQPQPPCGRSPAAEQAASSLLCRLRHAMPQAAQAAIRATCLRHCRLRQARHAPGAGPFTPLYFKISFHSTAFLPSDAELPAQSGAF